MMQAPWRTGLAKRPGFLTQTPNFMTLSGLQLVETALRNLFRPQKQPVDLTPLPSFHSGGAMVDIADRDALYQAMEGR